MSKMLIEFSENESHLLKELATSHGQAVKPFVEYLVKMQIGTVPRPTVEPVHFEGMKAWAEHQTEVERLRSSAPSETPRKDTKAVIPAEVKAGDFSGSDRHVTFAEVMDIEEAQENERTKAQVKEVPRKDAKAVIPAEVLTKAEPKGGSVRKGPAQGSIPETAFKEASTQDKMVREDNPIGKALLLKSLSYGEEKPHKVAAPVIPAEVAQEGKPAEGKPAQIPAQGFTINKDVNAYKERVEAGIFTDGKHFFVNKFGTKTFHVSLHSARIAKA